MPDHLASRIDYITPGIKLSPVIKRTVERKTKREFASVHVPIHANVPAEEEAQMLSAAAAALPAALQNCSRLVTPDVRITFSFTFH